MLKFQGFRLGVQGKEMNSSLTSTGLTEGCVSGVGYKNPVESMTSAELKKVWTLNPIDPVVE